MSFRTLTRILLRRGWVLPIAILGAAGLASLAANATSSSSNLAEAVVVVRAGAVGNDPGDARSASDLAATYVRSIPEDGGVIRAVSTAVNIDADDVADYISALGDPDTSIIRLRFEDKSEPLALAGAQALVESVTGSEPESRSVGPRVLEKIRAPRIIDSPSSSGKFPMIAGAVLGLLLAIIIMISLERSDPRIDNVDQIADELPSGITDLATLHRAEVPLVLDRWIELAGPNHGSGPVRVGLVPSEGVDSTVAIAAKIRDIARTANYPIAVDGVFDEDGGLQPAIDLVTASPGAKPGRSATGRVARGVDVIALVVTAGTKVVTLRHTLRTLQEFGSREVAWVFLVERRDVRQRRDSGSDQPSGGAPVEAAPPAEAAEAASPEKGGGTANGAHSSSVTERA